MDKPCGKTIACSLLDQCIFIRENRTKMSELVARIQHNYCTQSAHCRCARFLVSQSLGLEAVPSLMLPGQLDWARQIIDEYGRDLERNGQTTATQ